MHTIDWNNFSVQYADGYLVLSVKNSSETAEFIETETIPKQSLFFKSLELILNATKSNCNFAFLMMEVTIYRNSSFGKPKNKTKTKLKHLGIVADSCLKPESQAKRFFKKMAIGIKTNKTGKN